MRKAIKYFFIRLYHRFWLKSEFMIIDTKLQYGCQVRQQYGDVYEYVGNNRAVRVVVNNTIVTDEQIFKAIEHMRKIR